MNVYKIEEVGRGDSRAHTHGKKREKRERRVKHDATPVLSQHRATRCSEAELREEPQVLARAVAVLKDLTEVLLDLAAKTLTRIVSALAHDAAHVLGVEGVAVYKTKKHTKVRESTCKHR